jgi:SH3-like domain-containing protein
MCAVALLPLGGCGRLKPKSDDKYVYVTAKSAYLRDRVAAVSNRTGSVNNGDKLVVLEHARRFVKVRTAKGEIGWIDEKAVATQGVSDDFAALANAHAKEIPVGAATVRDEVYLHVAPGRDTAHFFRLNEGDKLSLLARASLAKSPLPGAAALKPAVAKTPAPAKSDKPAKGEKPKTDSSKPGTAAEDPNAAAAPVMEDWWLVRDSGGHTGWIYSRMIDVDSPDALARYAEGQRIVGAYVLTHVNDPDSGQLRDGQPDPDIPVYVTVLGPYKAGLPYDFDQVRVFSWNLKKHRYETAFRERNIAGYLPLTVTQMTDPYGKAANAATPLPAFSYKVLAGGQPLPTPDPVTGEYKPGALITKTYRLEGNITRRILPPNTPAPEEAHPAVEEKKDKAGKKHKK